jgi:hypothetical protein
MRSIFLSRLMVYEDDVAESRGGYEERKKYLSTRCCNCCQTKINTTHAGLTAKRGAVAVGGRVCVAAAFRQRHAQLVDFGLD